MAIMNSLWKYHIYTDLHFIPINSGENIYANGIVFKSSTGCSSYVGMVGGVQPINLLAISDSRGCRKGTVIHEIAHALGVYHEHSRKDRDKYVTIHHENIIPSKLHNFDIHSNSIDIKEYDYSSIMHYSPYAFTVNGGKTISTKNGTFDNIIGQRIKLSQIDIDSINSIYSKCHNSPSGAIIKETDSILPMWSTSPWSYCKDGYQKRSVYCRAYGGTSVCFDESYCSEEKPVTDRLCIVEGNIITDDFEDPDITISHRSKLVNIVGDDFDWEFGIENDGNNIFLEPVPESPSSGKAILQTSGEICGKDIMMSFDYITYSDEIDCSFISVEYDNNIVWLSGITSKTDWQHATVNISVDRYINVTLVGYIDSLSTAVLSIDNVNIQYNSILCESIIVPSTSPIPTTSPSASVSPQQSMSPSISTSPQQSQSPTVSNSHSSSSSATSSNFPIPSISSSPLPSPSSSPSPSPLVEDSDFEIISSECKLNSQCFIEFSNVYSDPIVICSPHYDIEYNNYVVRVFGVNNTGTNVILQETGINKRLYGSFKCVIIDKDVCNSRDDMECDTITTNKINGKNNKDKWLGTVVKYNNNYNKITVYGQVVTMNDDRVKMFWAANYKDRKIPPEANDGYIQLGMHSGEILYDSSDSPIEVINYLILNETDNSYRVSVKTSMDVIIDRKIALVCGNSMRGGDGFWPVISNDTIAIDEDMIYDNERVHTTEFISVLSY
jgi:hypothetical protein